MKSNRMMTRAMVLVGMAAVLIFAGCENAFIGSGDSRDLAVGVFKDLSSFSTTNDWAYSNDADGAGSPQGNASSTSGISVNSGSGFTYGVTWECGPGQSKGWCYGKGWNGAPPPTVYYHITNFFNPQAGCSGLYGWLEGSDGYVEFYVCETVGWVEGPHNNDNDGAGDYPEYLGSYTCDGCIYDFYHFVRTGKPNPASADSFTQWIAVNRGVNPSMRAEDTTPGRLFPRLSGKISLSEHFALWESTAGINKTVDTNNNGAYDEVDWTVFTIEAWKSHDTTSTSSGKETVTMSDQPLAPALLNVNLIGPPNGLTGPTMRMDGSNLSNSATISRDDPSAIFTMYTISMTLVSYPWASFPNDNYTHYGKIVAFKNGGYFLTVDDAGNVVRSSKTDTATLTDAEKFIYDNNYGYCDFESLKTYYRLNVDGKCLPGGIYGNFSIIARNDTPPQPAPSNYYYLNNNWSERMLTVADASGYASIYSQALNTGWASQKWRLEGISGGPPSPGASVRIRNIWSGKYLTVADTSDYADVKGQDLNTGWASQVWVIEGDLAQARFKNAWSGKYLTVTNQDECAAIKCQPFHYDWPSQDWRLQY